MAGPSGNTDEPLRTGGNSRGPGEPTGNRDEPKRTRTNRGNRGPAPTPELYALIGPPRGPCGLCGDPDARHRILDAVAELVRAGDDPADVAEDYGLTVEAVEAIAAGAP